MFIFFVPPRSLSYRSWYTFQCWHRTQLSSTKLPPNQDTRVAALGNVKYPSSYCGWNSVMEAALRGVPTLAWPQNGDQRLNAQVMKDAGLGLWDRNWDWGPNGIVKGDEIEKKIAELMTDEKLRERAKKVGEEAKMAVGRGGGSDKVLREVVESLITPF